MLFKNVVADDHIGQRNDVVIIPYKSYRNLAGSIRELTVHHSPLCKSGRRGRRPLRIAVTLQGTTRVSFRNVKQAHDQP